MYLVRHRRGMVSELGLKQLFRLLSDTLGMQNKILLKTQLDQNWRYSSVKLTLEQEVKETNVLDNNLRRGQPLALPIAQTCL